MILYKKDLKNTATRVYNGAYKQIENQLILDLQVESQAYNQVWFKLTTLTFREVWLRVWSQVRCAVYSKINKL